MDKAILYVYQARVSARLPADTRATENVSLGLPARRERTSSDGNLRGWGSIHQGSADGRSARRAWCRLAVTASLSVVRRRKGGPVEFLKATLTTRVIAISGHPTVVRASLSREGGGGRTGG